MKNEIITLRRNIKTMLWIFIVGLVISGITAFPIETEIQLFDRFFVDSQ